MHLLKLLGKLAIFVCVGVVALAVIGKVRQRSGSASSDPAATAETTPSAQGFVPLAYTGAGNPHVIILSPANCPKDNARRARALGASLTQAGIPTEMKSDVSFTFTDPADADRTNSS